MTNVTENENQIVVEELFCSETVTGGVHGQLTFISAINIFLSIAAFLGNTLILVAYARRLQHTRRPTPVS